MLHKSKKVKFRGGRDANRALMRKLAMNFVTHGHLETTTAKVKALKSLIDRLTYKAIQGTNADRNVLLRHLGSSQNVTIFVSRAGDIKGRSSGFVRMIKTKIRMGDGAGIARLEWVDQLQAESVAGKQSKAALSKPPAPADEKKTVTAAKRMAPKAKRPAPKKTGAVSVIKPQRKIP